MGRRADRDAIAVVPWDRRSASQRSELAALLAAYHLQTESEKGTSVVSIEHLPVRYAAEVTGPQHVFVDDVVLIARVRDPDVNQDRELARDLDRSQDLDRAQDLAVGCLVITSRGAGVLELRRLWTDPAHRGLGVASALLEAAHAHAARVGASSLRLSVWDWRTDAIGLYERLGYTGVDPWDDRDRLCCLERAL